jgi:hypothetical protein
MLRLWAGDVLDQEGKAEADASAARVAEATSAEETLWRVVDVAAEVMVKVVGVVWAWPFIQRGMVGRDTEVVDDMVDV